MQEFLSGFLVEFRPRKTAKIVSNFTSSLSLCISSFSTAISPHAVKTWSSLALISSRRADISPPMPTFIIFIRLRAIFSQPFARILVRFVLPHFWLYLFVGFHDRYGIKTFRTVKKYRRSHVRKYRRKLVVSDSITSDLFRILNEQKRFYHSL